MNSLDLRYKLLVVSSRIVAVSPSSILLQREVDVFVAIKASMHIVLIVFRPLVKTFAVYQINQL